MKTALAIVAALFVLAAGLVIAGIYMLAGLPWALMSTGLALFGVSVYLRAGLISNG